MKITDLLNEESDFDPGIKTALLSKGYKFLGKGVDQQAYLAPDNTVLKIFGTKKSQYRAGSTQLTKHQQSFIVFADYCKSHQDNPFLPKIYGWETFKFNNDIYLQIKMEQLAEIGTWSEWGRGLERIADFVEWRVSLWDTDPSSILEQLEKRYDDEYHIYIYEVLSHFGTDILKFIEAIKDLSILAKKYGFTLDLHGGNFMLTSNSDIVISDPFHAGFSTREPFHQNIGTAKIAIPNNKQANTYKIIRKNSGFVPGVQAEFASDDEAKEWFRTEVTNLVKPRVPITSFFLYNATGEYRINL